MDMPGVWLVVLIPGMLRAFVSQEKMNRTQLPKLLLLMVVLAAYAMIAGCATEQQLGRVYGVLDDKLDVSHKGLSNLLNQRLEENRQTNIATAARLAKEIEDLKTQNQVDIEINRREIQAAATRADLKRLEEAILLRDEGLEKKIISALDARVLALRNEASADRIKQTALASQIGELAADLKKYRTDMEKSSFQISTELQRSKETIIADFQKTQVEINAAREDIEKNIAQIERSRREIQLAGQELEKHKAEIRHLREAIEAGRLELSQNRQEIEKNFSQTEKINQELQRSKETIIADFQKTQVEINAAREDIEKNIAQTERSRHEIQLAGQELEKHKGEITQLREATAAGRLELIQQRLEIEKSLTEIEKNKTEIQLAALGVSSSRSELDRIKNVVDNDRQEIQKLANEIEVNRTFLTETRLLIEKGQTEIEKVGKDMMLSKSVGADMVADITDLRDKLLQFAGSLESLQRNHAITAKEQQTLQNTITGMVEAERKTSKDMADAERRTASEQALLTGRLDRLAKEIEFLNRYFNPHKKEPAAATTGQRDIAAAGKEPASQEVLYERAYDTFKEGKYEKARAEFQELLKRFPRGELAESAQFWIADSFFFENQFERAIVEYEKTLKDHPGGSRAPHVLLRQGLSFLSLGDKTEARLYLEKVLKDFPHSTQARVARSRLAELN